VLRGSIKGTAVLPRSIKQAAEARNPHLKVLKRVQVLIINHKKYKPEDGIPPTPASLGPMRTTNLTKDNALQKHQGVIATDDTSSTELKLWKT
jgi:hypothetical protein